MGERNERNIDYPGFGPVEQRPSFINRTIVAPRRGKPHIVFRAGWWRVSALANTHTMIANSRRWRMAHDFANRLNRTS